MLHSAAVFGDTAVVAATEDNLFVGGANSKVCLNWCNDLAQVIYLSVAVCVCVIGFSWERGYKKESDFQPIVW